MTFRSYALSTVCCLFCSTAGAAQDRAPAFFTAAAGLSRNLSFQGAGKSNGITARLEWMGLPLSRVLVAGLSVAYRPYDPPDVDYVFTELMVQSRRFKAGLRPYFGFGAGAAFPLESGSGRSTLPAVCGAGGLTLNVSRTWELYGEARFRIIGTGGAGTLDLTTGAALHLGS